MLPQIQTIVPSKLFFFYPVISVKGLIPLITNLNLKAGFRQLSFATELPTSKFPYSQARTRDQDRSEPQPLRLGVDDDDDDDDDDDAILSWRTQSHQFSTRRFSVHVRLRDKRCNVHVCAK